MRKILLLAVALSFSTIAKADTISVYRIDDNTTEYINHTTRTTTYVTDHHDSYFNPHRVTSQTVSSYGGDTPTHDTIFYETSSGYESRGRRVRPTRQATEIGYALGRLFSGEE